MAGKTGDEADKGFKVVDRRRVGVESSEPEKETPAAAPSSPAPRDASDAAKPLQSGPAGESATEPAEPDSHEQVLGSIDFQTFIVSLASSALIHLGELANPETGATEASLPHAKQTIDLLALLQQKTSGNLTGDESKLLQDLLRDLRLRYVHVTALESHKA